MNEHDLCDSRKEAPIQRAERVNATHYNEAKRIKKQLKAAMSDCLVWDNYQRISRKAQQKRTYTVG